MRSSSSRLSMSSRAALASPSLFQDCRAGLPSPAGWPSMTSPTSPKRDAEGLMVPSSAASPGIERLARTPGPDEQSVLQRGLLGSGLAKREVSAEPPTDSTLACAEGPTETSGPSRSRAHSSPDDAASACDNCKTAITSIDSTCAASTLSGCTSASTPFLSLLKVSPPTPVGRVAGRYKVHLWRSSESQPLGISFSSQAGRITVAQDMPHFGLRREDEVKSINGHPASSVQQCQDLLDTSRELELQLHHREVRDREREQDRDLDGRQGMACGTCPSFPDAEDFPVYCEPCFFPPEPRCRARSFPLRDLLLTTGPVPQDASGTFSLQMVRISRMQPFGLTVIATRRPQSGSLEASEEFQTGGSGSDDEGRNASSDGPAPDGTTERPVTIHIAHNVPHLGLLKGDELLQLNGVPATTVQAYKVTLKAAMTLSLELRRPRHLGLVKHFEEPSARSVSSVKDLQEVTPLGWLPSLYRRLGLDACSCPQTTSLDDTTAADRSHDIYLGRAL